MSGLRPPRSRRHRVAVLLLLRVGKLVVRPDARMQATGVVAVGRMPPVGHDLFGHPAAVLRHGERLDRRGRVGDRKRPPLDRDVVGLRPVGLSQPLGQLLPRHERRGRSQTTPRRQLVSQIRLVDPAGDLVEPAVQHDLGAAAE